MSNKKIFEVWKWSGLQGGYVLYSTCDTFEEAEAAAGKITSSCKIVEVTIRSCESRKSKEVAFFSEQVTHE